MDLLFNINSSNSEELNEILGFVDSDIDIQQVLPYLRRSTRNIIKWIGDANYTIAKTKYEADDFDDEFLLLIRYAIALGAMREFAPLLDVSFTTSGRAFRSDEHLKGAFEWMIDKSNDALERSYYASVDEVLTYIETTSGFELAPKIQGVKELFVNSLDKFQNELNINDSHLLFFNLVPSLRLAERRLIKSRTGDKFTAYKEGTNQPIHDLIKTICVYFAMADGIKKNSVQLFPRGVLKEVPGKAKHESAKQLDVEATVLYYNDQLHFLLLDLETLVAKDKQIISTKRDINFDKEDKFATM